MSTIEKSNPNENISTLVSDIKNGKTDNFLLLVNCYREKIISLAYTFNLSDSEREDLIQEGFIALYRAAITFDENKGASFSTYSLLCAKRRMINWVEKNIKPGFSPIPLSSFEDSELEKLAIASDSVEDDYIMKDRVAEVTTLATKLLSEKEKEIFDLYIKGYSPDEICKFKGIAKKSYDNALFRIRTKLRSAKQS